MDIVKINLENEMDLILSHKRCMKLAELCGLSVLIQTSFATAVSEISRYVIGNNADSPTLTLGLNLLKNNRKELVASVLSHKDFEKNHADAITYARRLADQIDVVKHADSIEIKFTQKLNYSGLINEERIQSFIQYFKKELPLSPYDELRKRNIQLLEVSSKLKESESQYKILTETLPLMVFTTNAGGYIKLANKGLKDFFKLLDIPDGKLHWTTFINNPGNSKLKEEWDSAFSAQTPLQAQTQLINKNNRELVWHLLSILPVKNNKGELISWTGFFVDIHAQKLVEETLKNNADLKIVQKKLLASQTKLEENILTLNKSNHDLEQFAYIASHDLQEPLRKIRNFTSLLERNIDDKESINKFLKKIDLSSERMLALIKDVLNYSRLSRVDSNFEEVNLNKIIDSILVDMELAIDEKKAVIKTADLPTILGIPSQMGQLFYNLIGNALKFNEGNPVISITSKVLSKEEISKRTALHKSIDYVEIIVKDNGIGFEEKYTSQIFTIFKRLNGKEEYAGTGIGLALCKKIVDNHHGVIAVKSAVNEGAEFHIILPQE